MPAPKSTSLDLADWIDRRRRASASPGTGATDVAAMHRAIDGAWPERAIELVEGADPRQTDPAELDWVRCRAWWEQSRWDEVRHLAASIPHSSLCEPLHVRVLVRAAWTDLLRGELNGDRIRVLERLRPWIVQGGSLEHAADLAHFDAYRALVHADDTAIAATSARMATSLYAHLGERGSETKTRILCIRILAIEGQLATAAEEARLAVAGAREAGHPRLLVQALNAEATVAWRRGEWPAAREGYECAIRLAEELDDPRALRGVQANLARLLAFSGELDAATGMLDALGPGPRNEPCTIDPVIEEYRGQVHLLRGQAQQALDHFDRCLQSLVVKGVESYERAQALLRKAEALLALDDVEAAAHCVDEGLDRLERYPQALDRGHLLYVRARCRRQQGRPVEARGAFDAAVRALRRTGDRWALLRCLLDRAAFDGIEPRQAVSDATEALALATRLGRVDLEDRARRQLAEAELRLHRGPETPAPAVEGQLVAEDPAMRALCAEARIAGSSDHPVLLQGETGTGKEVIARFLHDCSPRRVGPFVAVNCAAVPESLFEREFFGHARGAFTGADREGRGIVEEADGGTLFLDEVGELPLSLQPKLLRLLCEGTYRRVGETRPRRVDLRVVSATNRPLREASAAGRFRSDLFYRLSWFELQIPPLRQRSGDLMPLVWHFLRQEGHDPAEVGIEPSVWRALRGYGWPGNVRELESTIGAALVRAHPGGVIRLEHLSPAVRVRRATSGPPRLDLVRAVRRTERELILEALGRSRYRRSDAARLLGIGRNTLYEKMKKLGIQPERAPREAG